MEKLLERTAAGLKGSARSSLDKTIGLLQKFHIPLNILCDALIDYTAEFCVKTGYQDPPAAFNKAVDEAIKNNPR